MVKFFRSLLAGVVFKNYTQENEILIFSNILIFRIFFEIPSETIFRLAYEYRVDKVSLVENEIVGHFPLVMDERVMDRH